MNHFSVLIRLLRDRRKFLDEIRSEIKLETKIVSLLIASSFFLAVYGAIIGAYSGGLQIISSAIKLPALYLIALIICLPTLYFFDILFGSQLGFKQYLTMALTSVSVISVLLFSFAPVVLFFLISVQGYDFFLLLNVLIMAITGAVGIRLFYQGMREIVGPETNDQTLRHRLLKGWVILYGLVGSQLGWTLRPFFGAQGQSFQIFRPEINGNFYAKVIESIGTMLGF
ncbi:MAG: actin-binding WH2 domain-containing protein [Phormidesmis sp. RL_2_1]|nr:actin-binding WH2 domain-containing protein [Phormidesmis sp. RL_2_1]